MSKRAPRHAFRTAWEAGFTLLEVMIAIAIMMVAFAAILRIQSSGLESSIRARQMNTVAMLAKSKMVEMEHEFQDKTFGEFKKEDGGQFKTPYEDYRWTMKVVELKFPSLGVGNAQQEDSASGGGEGGQTDSANRIAQTLSKYLSEAVREVNVTIHWKRGSGEQSFTVSTYWVNLNHEMPINP